MAAFTVSYSKGRSMGQINLARIHWEALTPETRQAFDKTASLPFISQFYLAGGTGLALHLGHRFSMPLMIDHTPWLTMKHFLERQAMASGRKHLEDLWP